MAAAWVLVLVAAGLSLASAGPVPTSKPTTAWTDCDFGRFKSLSPRELEAFKEARDALENSLKSWSCTTRPFPRNRDLRQLQVWERPVALEAELALTLKVLGAMADASQGDILDQPLHTLRHMHSELQACVSAWGTEAVSRLSPQQAPSPKAASTTGCTGSKRPRGRSLKAASRPLSCSTSSASSKRTWNVSPVETCVSEDADPPPAHVGPQTLFMHEEAPTLP
uniref:Interferon lambda-1-like n=1 Tax=Felis catus TaxID=9685 RepID=A0ABI7YCR7_FELCA